jgi:hypothetical protein
MGKVDVKNQIFRYGGSSSIFLLFRCGPYSLENAVWHMCFRLPSMLEKHLAYSLLEWKNL